jgi:hypothetical protein
MLRFTPQQQQMVLANRRAFNNGQKTLSDALGSTFIGNASPLPKDVWGDWDRDAVQIQRSTLAVFNDLASAAQKPMAIGKLIHYFQRVTDSGEVNTSMDGSSKARTDQPTIDYVGTPLPIIDTGFSYSWRQMAAAETEGYFNLDATARDNANRRIAEKLENATLYGYSGIVVAGSASYGLLNHPLRSTRTTGVTLNGATGAQWMTEVIATLKLLHADNFKVPATLYMNWDDWFYASSTEFVANYPKTILQRIMEIEGVREIVPADSIPASNISAVVKDRRVVEVLNGMPMATRAKFRANPEDAFDFTVIAAAVLEIKYDAENHIGIAHSAP